MIFQWAFQKFVLIFIVSFFQVSRFGGGVWIRETTHYRRSSLLYCQQRWCRKHNIQTCKYSNEIMRSCRFIYKYKFTFISSLVVYQWFTKYSLEIHKVTSSTFDQFIQLRWYIGPRTLKWNLGEISVLGPLNGT